MPDKSKCKIVWIWYLENTKCLDDWMVEWSWFWALISVRLDVDPGDDGSSAERTLGHVIAALGTWTQVTTGQEDDATLEFKKWKQWMQLKYVGTGQRCGGSKVML